MPRGLMRMLYPEPAVINDDRHFYDYYDEASAADVANTKWARRVRQVSAALAAYGATVEGASVLDVSGGPGFLTKSFAGRARRAVVTEFSEQAVEGMAENLGIEAIKYDYNRDELQERVGAGFDLVVIDASINFCLDLNRFAAQLRRVVSPNALVYMTYAAPTLGCCLRWQFDDYTYNALYPKDVIVEAFGNNGFVIVDSVIEESFRYTDGLRGKPLYQTSRWLSGVKPGARRLIDSSLDQHACRLVLRSDATTAT